MSLELVAELTDDGSLEEMTALVRQGDVFRGSCCESDLRSGSGRFETHYVYMVDLSM
jgi:hypothetical protein